MKKLDKIFFLLTINFHTILAEHATNEQIIIFVCQRALSSYQFDCDNSESYWKCICKYPPMFGSLVSCIDTYLPDNTPKYKSWRKLQDNCLAFGQISLSQEIILDGLKNASRYLIDGDDDVVRNQTNYVPVLPSKDAVTGDDSGWRDYWVFLGNLDLGQYDGFLINYYFLFILLISGISFHLKKFSIIRAFHFNFIRRYITLPLLFNSHSSPYRFYYLEVLLPTTSESLVLLIYFLLNAHFIFIGYETYPNNHLFGPDMTKQWYRLIADRSGIIAFAHLPLLVLFAGRNNILISLTGVNYASFMIYHKWTARVMFLDSLIHTHAYLTLIDMNGSRSHFISEQWFIKGSHAIQIGLLIMILAVYAIRTRWYEIFLITHILLAGMFFYGCYIHCLPFGWLSWVNFSVLFWGLDRCWRIWRLYQFGLPRAKFEFISEVTFKITVERPFGGNWNPFPGCFVYIYFIHPKLFWQSHPFTIMDSIVSPNEVTIYVKAKRGLTSSVLNIILTTSNPCGMRICLEGPYGFENPLKNYDNVLLLAGGNGIPGPYYHAIELLKSSLIPKRRIKLIWVTRTIDSLKWFEKELEVAHSTYLKYFEFEIHITAPNFELELIRTDPLLIKFKGFHFYKGRLDLENVLLEEIEDTNGSLAIATCGPPLFCDQIRSIVAKKVEKCSYRLDLFEELQVW